MIRGVRSPWAFWNSKPRASGDDPRKEKFKVTFNR